MTGFYNKVAEWRLANLIKRGSDAGIFLWIFQSFQEHVFCGTSTNSSFWIVLKLLGWSVIPYFDRSKVIKHVNYTGYLEETTS